MESLEVSARTVEEAVKLALDQLGANRSEVEIEVLSEGRSGILGLGAEDAKVRVKLLHPPSAKARDMAGLAQRVIEDLLAAMKVSASVFLRPPPEGQTVSRETSLTLDIRGDDLGILIGRRGETLSTLQYMVNLIVGRQLKSRTAITIDIEGYRQRREESLRNLALRMAERVRSTGQPVTLQPMPASERRIVHLALQPYQDIVTQSLGEGENRKVSISLRSQ